MITIRQMFLKIMLLLIIILGKLETLTAQQNITVNGRVKTFEGNFLQGATVLLWKSGVSDTLKTLTNLEGLFVFNKVKSGKINIKITYIGFKAQEIALDYSGKNNTQLMEDVVMFPEADMLGNITLESQKIQIKEDTISYKIDSTMYRKNDNVEAMLKNLPGVQVDKDGTVTAQGKQVTRVKVNGKEFFGGDVTTATRELNADMVDKIQVIDDYGDQAAFTGIKDGDPSKTLNIQLKKDRNKGYFGNLTAGAGTEERYVTNASINKFNNNQQISLLLNLNNTNTSTFNFGNIGGAMGNMMSSMARGMGIGRGGSGVGAAFTTGNNDGISTNQSVGLNYRDEWGTKVSSYGSYSFSKRITFTEKSITQQNIFNGKTNSNIQESVSDATAFNHRFSYNIEYKIDTMNYLKFTPTITYNRNETGYVSDFYFLDENGLRRNEGQTTDNSISKTPNLNGNLLFNHRFRKKGRNLSLNFNGSKSSSESDDDFSNSTTYFTQAGNNVKVDIYQNIIQDNSNHAYGLRSSYTEPLTKRKSLEFNYAYNFQFTGNDRKTYLINPSTNTSTYIDSLSNIYDNDYITHRFGMNFRTTEKKYNYTVGFAVQPATIRSNIYTGTKTSYTQHLVNYYPVIRFAYNYSKSRSLNVNYNGSTSQPSFTQLQPVRDISNPQYITIGNPELRPEFTNTLSVRYNNFDLISGNVFFGNLSFSFTDDKIVSNTKQLRPGIQETRYLNSNGYYTVFAFYNISRPIQNRKFVFNIGGNITYNNNVSYVTDSADAVIKNIGRNWILGQRFAVDIRIKKWLETSFSVNYSLNSSRYSLLETPNSNTTAWVLSHSSRFFLPKDFILSYEIDQTLNSGYADNVNANPLIINATLEKQLFKKKNASIKLQAFDLLNEQTNITRLVSGTSIVDTRTNRLGQYFMLSFVFRLNKFSAQQQAMPGMPGGNMPMMMRPGM
jgi:hypothetical protein